MTRPLTVKELAEHWRVGAGKVRELCRAGEIDCFRLGKTYRIKPQAIADYEAKSWKPSAPIEENASSNGQKAASEKEPQSQGAGRAVKAMREAAKKHALPSKPSNVSWLHSSSRQSRQWAR